MFLLCRGVAQLGQSAAFGTQRSQVQILSPRLHNPLKYKGLFFLTTFLMSLILLLGILIGIIL